KIAMLNARPDQRRPAHRHRHRQRLDIGRQRAGFDRHRLRPAFAREGRALLRHGRGCRGQSTATDATARSRHLLAALRAGPRPQAGRGWSARRPHGAGCARAQQPGGGDVRSRDPRHCRRTWDSAAGRACAAADLLCGALLILIGARARRAHARLAPWLIAAGATVAIAGVAYFVPTLSLVTVEAYPTSFYVASTGYSASSIVQGANLFATHCASCHGREGRGDGPAGRFLRVK